MHKFSDFKKNSMVDSRQIYNRHIFELEEKLKENVKNAERIKNIPLT